MNIRQSSSLLLFLFLFPIFLIGQWKTDSGQNRFDGSYRAAYVIGKGGKWPNNTPILRVVKWKEGHPNIYLTNIGYTGCSENRLKIAFDNTDDVIETNLVSPDLDKEALIIDAFRTTLKYDFIRMLQKSSRVYIRHISSCGVADYEFTLSGSSRALEYAAGSYLSRIEEDRLEMDSYQVEQKQKTLLKISALDSLFNCGTKLQEVHSFYPNKKKVKIPLLELDSIETTKIILSRDNIKIYNFKKDDLLLVSIRMEGLIQLFYISPSVLETLADDMVIESLSENFYKYQSNCNVISKEEINTIIK